MMSGLGRDICIIHRGCEQRCEINPKVPATNIYIYIHINIKILYTQSRDGLEHVSPVSKRDIILGIYAKFQGGTGIQMWKFQKQPHSMLTRISLVSMSKRTLLRSLPKSSSHIV